MMPETIELIITKSPKLSPSERRSAGRALFLMNLSIKTPTFAAR